MSGSDFSRMTYNLASAISARKHELYMGSRLLLSLILSGRNMLSGSLSSVARAMVWRAIGRGLEPHWE
eukprot:4167295-Karenia_brevis.AAC.1